MPVDAELYKLTMRRLAGAVSIVTTLADDGKRNGFTATAVCSVTVSPPTLLVCANRADENHEMIHSAGFFAVNLLRADEQNLSNGFSGAAIGEARFSLGRWSRSPQGVPVLESALAWCECRMTHHVFVGTHGVFFGTIEALKLNGPVSNPLLYFDGGYGTFDVRAGPQDSADSGSVTN